MIGSPQDGDYDPCVLDLSTSNRATVTDKDLPSDQVYRYDVNENTAKQDVNDSYNSDSNRDSAKYPDNLKVRVSDGTEDDTSSENSHSSPQNISNNSSHQPSTEYSPKSPAHINVSSSVDNLPRYGKAIPSSNYINNYKIDDVEQSYSGNTQISDETRSPQPEDLSPRRNSPKTSQYSQLFFSQNDRTDDDSPSYSGKSPVSAGIRSPIPAHLSPRRNSPKTLQRAQVFFPQTDRTDDAKPSCSRNNSLSDGIRSPLLKNISPRKQSNSSITFNWSREALDKHMDENYGPENGTRSRHVSKEEATTALDDHNREKIHRSKSYDDVNNQTKGIITSFMYETHRQQIYRRHNNLGHSNSSYPLEDLGSPSEGVFNETDHDTMRHDEQERDYDSIEKEFKSMKDQNFRKQNHVALCLVSIGDSLNYKQQDIIDSAIDDLNIQDTEVVYDTFSKIGIKLMEIDSDGIEWSRIVILLIFGYRLALKTLQVTGYANFFSKMISFVSEFFKFNHITRWIADRGGWIAVLSSATVTVSLAKIMFVITMACAFLSLKLLNF